MARYRAILEKVEVHRMVVEFNAPSIEAAVRKAERATTETKVQGMVIVKPYDVGHVSSRERVNSLREVK